MTLTVSAGGVSKTADPEPFAELRWALVKLCCACERQDRRTIGELAICARTTEMVKVGATEDAAPPRPSGGWGGIATMEGAKSVGLHHWRAHSIARAVVWPRTAPESSSRGATVDALVVVVVAVVAVVVY